MKKPAARPPLFEVRHSPIHGHGVFALRRIRKGTTVIEYVGERVSHAEADARYEDKHPDDNHTFLFTVDSKTVIDGGVGGNEARYINHGCDPNCESTTLKKRIYVEAIRTIQPGEELNYDYQIERDPEDPPNVDEIFACRCGAAKCRGSMLVPRRKPRAPKGKTTAGSRSVGTSSAGRGRGSRSAAKRPRREAAKTGSRVVTRSKHLTRPKSRSKAGARDRSAAGEPARKSARGRTRPPRRG